MGGNDADQGMDLNNFTDSYTSLINDLTSENRHIIVSGLLPRASANLDPYNERLRTLCEDQNIDFVDSYNSFLLAQVIWQILIFTGMGSILIPLELRKC